MPPLGARVSKVSVCPVNAAKAGSGTVEGDSGAELVITFDEPGKVFVARDRQGQTVRIEGDVTVKTVGIGTVSFSGVGDINTAEGTSIHGTLVLDLAKNVSVKIRGQVHPQTHKARAGARVILVF